MNTEGYDPKTTIFPTFECFTDSMEFIEHIAMECPEIGEQFILVHAICTAEIGRDFSHSWVEDTKNQVAIFCGIYMDQKTYFAAPLENFFRGYSVKESTRYTVAEAIQNNLRTVHFGPWEEKYQALCRNGEPNPVLGGGYMEKVIQIGVLPKHEKPTTGG